jgi:pyruvate carboxylase subunit B
MEAMKLENKLPATRDGVVKKILVRDGDVVSQGQELILIS